MQQTLAVYIASNIFNVLHIPKVLQLHTMTAWRDPHCMIRHPVHNQVDTDLGRLSQHALQILSAAHSQLQMQAASCLPVINNQNQAHFGHRLSTSRERLCHIHMFPCNHAALA